jgi:hypothetical protein
MFLESSLPMMVLTLTEATTLEASANPLSLPNLAVVTIWAVMPPLLEVLELLDLVPTKL